MRHVLRALCLSACVLLSAQASFAQGGPRTIVCIDNNNDAFTNDAEGYLRARYPNAVFKRGGGTLTDCLGQLRDGDTLIVVCHANAHGFGWGGEEYDGFGAGDGRMPVPDGFGALRNITIIWIGCETTQDPDGDGEDRPLVDKLRDAMGGAANGHPAPTGFMNTVITNVNYGLSGGTPEQQAAARQCLTNDRSWERNHPPANRPNTGGQGQPANQQSAAQAQVNNNCPGAGGAVAVTIPNAVSQPAGPNQAKTPGYKEPVNRAQYAARVPGPECVPPPYCGCADPPEGVSAEVEAGIPTLSFWALAVMGLALLTVGVVVLRRPGL